MLSKKKEVLDRASFVVDHMHGGYTLTPNSWPNYYGGNEMLHNRLPISAMAYMECNSSYHLLLSPLHTSLVEHRSSCSTS